MALMKALEIKFQGGPVPLVHPLDLPLTTAIVVFSGVGCAFVENSLNLLLHIPNLFSAILLNLDRL